ncbi:MAG: ABC transporter substrate-binding protein, partial [Deltaproteobacteria bacterium]|nr:ABC transporter substrate-binding protein [Deltaproteobacteria bacterium]
MRLHIISFFKGLLFLVCFGCRSGAPHVQFRPGTMVLHLASRDDVPTLDPVAGYDTASWGFEQMLFDTLVRYSDSGVDLVPDAAIGWESSADARTFTLHLRHNIRFSTGRPLTSDDFKFEIERVLDPANNSQGIEYYRGITGAEQYSRGEAKTVAGIETLDRWTIIFHLTTPDPIFLAKLAMPFAAAVPREIVERYGREFSRNAVGSGPFMLKEWKSGQRIVLVRNRYYFAVGIPHLDAVVEQMGVDDNLEWLKYETGAIDIAAIPPAEFPYVMKTPRLKSLTLKLITLATDYLGMNCQMPPFTDVRVRRAFNYAINKDKLIAVFNRRGVAASGILPPGLPGYDPGIRGYAYNPAKARQLLEQAGITSEFVAQLWIRADETQMMLAQSIQQDLALVGIHLLLKPVAWPPLLEAIRQPGTVELALSGWEADFPDPENFLEVLFARKQWGANNNSFYYDPKVDALFGEAGHLTNMKQRYSIYDEAEKIIVADAPWAFLYYPVAYAIRQPWVHGYVLNPM